jgi:hypothetical protein
MIHPWQWNDKKYRQIEDRDRNQKSESKEKYARTGDLHKKRSTTYR